jgi:hypothetical protein
MQANNSSSTTASAAHQLANSSSSSSTLLDLSPYLFSSSEEACHAKAENICGSPFNECFKCHGTSPELLLQLLAGQDTIGGPPFMGRYYWCFRCVGVNRSSTMAANSSSTMTMLALRDAVMKQQGWRAWPAGLKWRRIDGSEYASAPVASLAALGRTHALVPSAPQPPLAPPQAQSLAQSGGARGGALPAWRRGPAAPALWPRPAAPAMLPAGPAAPREQGGGIVLADPVGVTLWVICAVYVFQAFIGLLPSDLLVQHGICPGPACPRRDV